MVFNLRLEFHAGDTRTLRLPIATRDAELLDLVNGGASIDFWLADNSQPADDAVHVKLSSDDGVAIVEVDGVWHVDVPLLPEHTADLVGDLYLECRVTRGVVRLVVAAGTLTVRPSVGARYGIGG